MIKVFNHASIRRAPLSPGKTVAHKTQVKETIRSYHINKVVHHSEPQNAPNFFDQSDISFQSPLMIKGKSFRLHKELIKSHVWSLLEVTNCPYTPTNLQQGLSSQSKTLTSICKFEYETKLTFISLDQSKTKPPQRASASTTK